LWLNPEGRLIWINSAIEHLTGYAVNECMLLPDFPLTLASPEERGRLEDALDHALRYHTASQDFEFRGQKRDGKLFFGPIWDFDIAMGSNWFSEGQNPEGWVIRLDPWFAQLFKDPTFASEVSARWFELKNAGVFDDLLRYARARANWLAPHKQENFTRWPLQGNLMLWLRDYEDHPAELNKLLNFVQTRYQWLDRQFALTQKEAK
jgi:hypothetical protein